MLTSNTNAVAPRFSGVVAILLWAAIALHAADTAGTVAQRYCQGCHNSTTKSGGLDLKAPTAAGWEKVVTKVKAGMMPPAGAPRPSEDVLKDFVRSTEMRLDRMAAANPNPGRPLLHRLNRT